MVEKLTFSLQTDRLKYIRETAGSTVADSTPCNDDTTNRFWFRAFWQHFADFCSLIRSNSTNNFTFIDVGYPGAPGFPGTPGRPGLKGARGEDGAVIGGAVGLPGFAGRPGIPGAPGTKGERGDMGFEGLPGIHRPRLA